MGPTDPVARGLLSRTAEVDDDGRLSIGGVDVVDLAGEHGTPLYVYDEEDLRTRCREAVEAWGEGVAYATKAFLCVAMARLAFEEGMHLDVSTGGELHVALTAGVPAERLVLHGNNKSDAELARAMTVGIGRIVVDSFDEIDRIEGLLSKPSTSRSHLLGRGAEGPFIPRPKVLARVTPGVEVHTHEYVRTGQHDSKFGFGLASGAATEAVERLRSLHNSGMLEFVGIHAHLGSQVFSLDPFVMAVEILADFFAPLGLPELVVGGGLGVAYVNGEEGPPMAQWAARVKSACSKAGIPDPVR
ncbi:MAG: diaminopimelate decarboxylase family protein, partial [Acidimicrobiales bacterium]